MTLSSDINFVMRHIVEADDAGLYHSQLEFVYKTLLLLTFHAKNTEVHMLRGYVRS